MEQEQQNFLNPKAPEFFPPLNSPPIFYHHLPLSVSPSPPPTSYTYYQQQPPSPYTYYHPQPPVMLYYHHHFLSPPPPSKQSFALLNPHHLHLALADGDGLSFTTCPTTSPSPLTRYRKPSTRKTHGSKSNGKGRIHNENSQSIWVKKNPKIPSSIPDLTLQLDDTPLDYYPFGNSTSLMIRHIPVRLSRKELTGMLDEHCREQNEKCSVDEPLSEFDLLYLPVDFTRKGNLGYAFVNFTTWQGASRLYNSWKSTNWENCSYNTKKICQIHAAKYQGEELKKHFKRSMFDCETDEYLPVEITPARDGSNSELTQLTTLGTRVSNPRISN